jgi:hypothetical protein
MSRFFKDRTPRPALCCAALLLCLLPVADALAAPPTVNGLFYGDGDDGRYQPYATSIGGSVLYAYFDAPNKRLYVALVVDHAVNDLVCSPQNNGAYTQSAGWPNHRSCKRATDSEFASFTLQCAPGSPNSWSWQQALGCSQTTGPPPANWVSTASCPSSAGTWPPSTVASSSFVANVNTYQAAAPATRAWNLYTHGTAVDNWKSPFLSASPNNATLVPGYPTYSTTNGSGLFYDWEWSMVYEWSVNLGTGGTNCGDEPIFFITGQSHHSPAKTGSENDTFPPQSNPIISDFGDLPNSYGTTTASNGARHYLTVNGPYLGVDVQAELNGQPTADATGDGAEEDGVKVIVNGNWTAGSTQSIEVTVGNAPSGALLGAWFDWNGDGDVNDPGEFFSWNVVQGVNQLQITVGAGFDWQVADLYSRFRIFSSGAAAPGGSLNQADSVGIATNGEVEDYVFTANSLPVTLNAFVSELTGAGDLTVQWQTASETDNVGFELWGLVRGEWRQLGDMVQSKAMSSALPQTYEMRVAAPQGLASLQLVDYDSRGRAEQFGPFRLGVGHGEVQPVERIDWSGPRRERAERLEERGFVATGRGAAARVAGRVRSEQAGGAPSEQARWKKLERETIRGTAASGHGASAVSVQAGSKGGQGKGPTGGGDPTQQTIRLDMGAMTHVAVTRAGIQRITYEVLRDGGLDLAGVESADVAVTWRGAAVERWIDGPAHFGPGSAIEFIGRPPQGDDALYVDAALYQVSVDASRARSAKSIGRGAAKRVSAAYARQTTVDRQASYFPQSPTGDPWIERSVLVRGGGATVTLDLPIDEPVLAGATRLTVGLGTVSELPERRDAGGTPIPEHNVEVWFAGPGTSFVWVATAAASGQQDWTIEAALPAGMLATGLNRVQLRFSTAYSFSLVVVDRYGVDYLAPYQGPTLDFPVDPSAQGYVVSGFDGPAVAVYAEGPQGALTRIDPRVSAAGGQYVAEIRSWDAERFWVTDSPQAPAVFTTEAPADLLAGPADLVVIADSSFIGTDALDAYLAQTADFNPVVIDVEDVYNGVGFGMAVPGAITDYLAARNAIHPFTHVQLVGTDCYDRMNRVSSCLSFIPLPTAPVGVILYSPSHNRLADLDGDGVADVAVGQFSVRTEAELATIVGKGASWRASGLAATESALLIAEETDGLHNFAGQIERMRSRLAWSDADVLDMSDYPAIATARTELRTSLAAGRALTVFSGHSSPAVWAFRGLLTAGSVATLTNAGLPTLVVPLACETTYDVSPNANVLGHQLLYGGDRGALAISGAVALASLSDNERMAEHVLEGLKAGLTLGEAVQAGRRALGSEFQTLQDNWLTQGDVTTRMAD